MSNGPTPLYEGLFLLNQEAAAADFGGCVEFLKEVFERAEAELIVLSKWDERRLAYSIKGQKRGTYMLAYFRARGAQIANIERDCNLSDQVLRSMMVRADHIGETELELARKEASDLSVETKLRSPADSDHDAGDEIEGEGDEASGADAVAVQVAGGDDNNNNKNDDDEVDAELNEEPPDGP